MKIEKLHLYKIRLTYYSLKYLKILFYWITEILDSSLCRTLVSRGLCLFPIPKLDYVIQGGAQTGPKSHRTGVYVNFNRCVYNNKEINTNIIWTTINIINNISSLLINRAC